MSTAGSGINSTNCTKCVHRFTCIKGKLFKVSGNIWFNKMYQTKSLVPNYANIRMRDSAVAKMPSTGNQDRINI